MTNWSAYQDDISDAISDSADLDWNANDGARAVVRWLNEHRPLSAAPAPEGGAVDWDAKDQELIERGLRTIRTHDAVRYLRDALSATTARLTGYDWNADPDGVTKQQGDAFAAADRVFADLDAAVAAHPEIELPECQTCGGTGKIEEAAKTEGANQHSACVRTCDDCDGCGFAPDDEQESLRAQPQAREDDSGRPIEATWTDGATHAYVNLSAALSAERQAWRQKLGLRIASVRYLDVEVPPAREDAQPVAKVVRLGFSKGGISFTSAGNEADLPDGTPLFTHPAPDALREAVALLERWYATRSEMSGAGTVETETRQFIATLQAEQKGGA